MIFLIALAVIMWAFRFPLLRGLGNFLIHEDDSCRADVIYTLGGSPLDRGVFTALLLQQGCAQRAYCTGENIPGSYKAEGRSVTEAELTRTAAIREGALPTQVLPYPYGTSTWEEAAGVLHHARSIGVDTILLVTTDFHTRRVNKVFEERFEGSGITVLVKAAPSSDYEVDEWYRTEQGLLMVNNEYVKTLYYAITY
ncbi:MAG: YdcF family protein [Flavobacteriales bacterium]